MLSNMTFLMIVKSVDAVTAESAARKVEIKLNYRYEVIVETVFVFQSGESGSGGECRQWSN